MLAPYVRCEVGPGGPTRSVGGAQRERSAVKLEAYVTVTDASGRVLLRRPATAEEIAEALRAADDAEQNARATLAEIAAERGLLDAGDEGTVRA